METRTIPTMSNAVTESQRVFRENGVFICTSSLHPARDGGFIAGYHVLHPVCLPETGTDSPTLFQELAGMRGIIPDPSWR
jgi:hypothetical protein